MITRRKIVKKIRVRREMKVEHKGFLINQSVERIKQFIDSARIGRIQGKVIDIERTKMW